MITESYSNPPEVSTREPRPDDLVSLEAILNQTVIDAETQEPIEREIESILGRVAESITSENTGYRYLVAEDSDGKVLGMMGVTQPDDEMRKFAIRPESCIELINAYVRPRQESADDNTSPPRKGRGAGAVLVRDLLELAKANGATEVVVNSGPRYKETGWPFWTKTFGEKQAQVLPDHYGEGLDAMVWRADI